MTLSRSFLLLAYLAHLALTTAQSGSLLPNTLPACATSCQVLQQAATGCIPPAAPVTSQETYQSCFCQSALLTSLQQTPTANICAPQCSDADFATIDQWYKSVCPAAGGGAGGTTFTTITTSPAGTAAETNNPTSIGNDAPVSTGGDRSDEAGASNGQAW